MNAPSAPGPQERSPGAAADLKRVPDNDRLTGSLIEIAIRFAALGLLLYWSVTLVRPFATIVIWSVVLTVAIYPAYKWIVRWVGGRRRLAAVLVTLATFLVIVGPVSWLLLGLIDSVRTLSEHVAQSDLALPHPPESVKSLPFVGARLYQFWELASTNTSAAFAKVAPQLKPVGTSLLQMAGSAGAGALQFLLAIAVAGFLFAPAPLLLGGVTAFTRRLSPGRGDAFVKLAGATIRSVAQGVVGVSVLQALLAGIGLVVAGVPGASLLTSAVLICGIIQIGPSVVLVPLVIWSWFSMEATSAALFTAYMVPVNLLDNVLRPLVMGRGLTTPTPVILLGVLGGTIGHGITGLFLGPIILAVIWELFVSWIAEQPAAPEGLPSSAPAGDHGA